MLPLVPQRSERVEHDDTPRVGEWFMVKGKKSEWLGCVIAHGSNYFEMQSVPGGTVRIHLKEFWEECRRAEDADKVIADAIEGHHQEMQRLIKKVHALTARLHVAPMQQLAGGAETQALSTRQGTGPIKDYKKALIKAKDEQLPALFEKIREESEAMADWMKARLIPLQAEAEGMKGVLGVIKDRIFSVELYAGITEEIVQVAEGAPAANDEKVHLFQRRAYMDEECLAAYETGGMEMKDIKAFDKWLCRPANLNRLLPFPRCVVAFRVRRNTKEREAVSLHEYIQMMRAEAADKYTYLYIRNGEQVFRIATAIEFDEKLFPDLDHSLLQRGRVWARMFANSVDAIISDDEYQGMLEEEAANDEEVARAPESERWHIQEHKYSEGYIEYTPASVHYDDITKYIGNQIKDHNRIVLVLQGLLDRSPVFHPHPPWQLWTAAGFAAALTLIHDDSRALSAGEKPDFEAYRAKLNASLKAGSITVGQEEAWERLEAKRENERQSRSWRSSVHDRRHTHFRPYGNPGPGLVAAVDKCHRNKDCSYVWTRKPLTRRRWNAKDVLNSKITVKAGCLLNIDAYKPGDFHIFFDDPRTRAEYLKWAPLLLEAEEYHAGNRPLRKPGDVEDE